jgi:pyruvate kinase
MMPVADNVDEMVDLALEAARESAGLRAGAQVVLTAGRQTGTPGATNLVMIREIP